MKTKPKKSYTWDDLTAAIGRDFSGGLSQTGADPLEKSAIRRFCEPLEMDCPLHYDDEIARQNGYEGVVAPISMINQTLIEKTIWKPGEPTPWDSTDPDHVYAAGPIGRLQPLPMPPTSAEFATELEIEYFAPVYIGDTLTIKGGKLISVNVRETSIGSGAFVTIETEIYNQRGELVARQKNGSYKFNPYPKFKRKKNS